MLGGEKGRGKGFPAFPPASRCSPAPARRAETRTPRRAKESRGDFGVCLRGVNRHEVGREVRRGGVSARVVLKASGEVFEAVLKRV